MGKNRHILAQPPAVLVLLIGEVRDDPRVARTCRSLRDAGFAVTAACTSPSGGPPREMWEGIRIVRFPHRRFSLLKRLYLAAAGRIPPKMGDALGRMHEEAPSSPFRAAVRNMAASLNARTFIRETLRINRFMTLRFIGERFDFIHANDADTLPAGCALKRAGAAAALVYDAHEFWPGVGVDGSAGNDAVRRLEAGGIREADAVLTVNPLIAEMIAREYSLERTPGVVMNCPHRDDAPFDPAATGRPLRVLYQGKVQAFRGVGELILAFKGVDDAVLTVSGDGPLLDRFRLLVKNEGLGDRVRLEGRFAPEETLSIVRGHDVGVLPFSPATRSITYSSPNKLFDYMMGGLAVLASDLPFIRSVVEGADAGMLLSGNSPGEIAAAVKALAADPERVARYRRNAREAALARYSWEEQFSNYPLPGRRET